MRHFEFFRIVSTLSLLNLQQCLSFRWPLKSTKDANNTIVNSQKGCIFDFKQYSIGDKWNPDLPPFGPMYCIACACERVSRSLVRGKVTCRNVRSTCPPTSCASPMERKGKCCLTCPEEFIGLLAPSRRPRSSSRQTGLARVHMTLTRKSLHISIHYIGSLKLKLATFVGPGDIHIKDVNIQRRATNGTKTCLIWNHMRDNDVTLLKEEKLAMILKFKRNSFVELRGRLSQYNSYSEEAFESLLFPASGDDRAGALTSLTLAKDGNSTEIFLRLKSKRKNGTAVIQLVKRLADDNGIRSLRTFTVASKTPDTNGDLRIVWPSPPRQALKWLARGLLDIIVNVTSSGKNRVLTGRMQIKQTCNSLFSAMSGREAPKQPLPGSSGFTLLRFDDVGRLHYKVLLSGLTRRVMEINVESSTKPQRVFKRLSRVVSADIHGRAEVSGVWQRPTFEEICWLFEGELSVNVRTAAFNKGEIRGKVKQLPYGGHHVSYQDVPTVLSGNEVVPRIQTGAAGQAWFSLDKHCDLHYHLVLVGINHGRKIKITADLAGYADIGQNPQPYDQKIYSLRTFSGKMVTGVVRNLSPDLLLNLLRGLVYIQIRSDDKPHGELRSQVFIHRNTCSKRLHRPSQSPSPGFCTVDGKVHLNQETWVSKDDPKCTKCSCKDSVVSCKKTLCTTRNCSEALVLLPNMCCPACPVQEDKVVQTYKKGKRPNVDGCFVEEDNKVFPSGSIWHPYVQPFGTMKCIACMCEPNSKEIKCNKVQCPKLKCRNAKKLIPTDCCPRCPDAQHHQSSSKIGQACKFGGNTFPSGSRWSPFIKPFGLMKCITCDCKDGSSKCVRVSCPKGFCQNSIERPRKNCCVPCSGAKGSQ